MNLKNYNPVSRNWRVLLQEMPEEWVNSLPTAEEIWVGGNAGEMSWKMSKENGNFMFRHYRWHKSDNFPEIFSGMMKHLQAEDISMFAGDNDTTVGSLGWHVDDYHVWAFNIEGETEWEYFDLTSGTFKSETVKPGYILTMPLGISHRVKVLSEYRTSVSMITRYGASRPRTP